MIDVKTIEHMWKVASNNPNHDTNWHDPVVIKFAELVAQHEREECAKLIEEMPCDCCWPEDSIPVAVDFADAIRARGEA